MCHGVYGNGIEGLRVLSVAFSQEFMILNFGRFLRRETLEVGLSYSTYFRYHDCLGDWLWEDGLGEQF